MRLNETLNLGAVYMAPLTRDSMKCEVFWAIEISRTSRSNKIAGYKLYEIPCFRQKTNVVECYFKNVFFHYISSSGFLISFKQYLKLPSFRFGAEKRISIAQNTSHFIESRLRGTIYKHLLIATHFVVC
jgi:hypothetical protein